MAKTTKASSTKIKLNTKKQGVAKKSYGPKDQRPKAYRGQGR
jgi:hypothetical protein